MDIIINGVLFRLNSINDEVDKSFLDLYQAFFDSSAINLDDFEKKAHNYFDFVNEIEDKEKRCEWHDTFFNNFINIWEFFRSRRNYEMGEWIWEKCIDFAHHWEIKNSENSIHKGTPFYFWGMTAIFRGDMSKGYALMHKALQEDIRRHGSINPQTPSFAFVIADYQEKNQAFHKWTINQAEYIDKQISIYNKTLGKNFCLEEFWKKIKNSDLDTSTIYQFALYITNFYDVTRKPDYIYEGDFASQILLDLLFNLSRIVDSVLQNKNKSEWKIFNNIVFLDSEINIGLPQKKMEVLSDAYKARPSGFEMTLSSILDNTYSFPDGSKLSLEAKAFAITSGIRNYAAHNIITTPIISKHYKDIEMNMFFSLFLIVENIY